ncbi:hypothetical protein L6164_033240 [Bauhinia variegata]|uniref:Uncharacterized protein n=1 Tax=Bauhinia variegata TaxID=167791 RepID=A0ACB9KR69_BAUVA|nr:hypothetical protein L6164_033240 [Bauhinia variegata]
MLNMCMTQGERLSKAHSYLIAIGHGLGRSYITLQNVGVKSCPLPLIGAPPLPVKFSDNLPFPDPFASTNILLNFTFVDVPRCSNTSKWFVAFRVPEGWNFWFGDLSVRGDFYIKPYVDQSYKIIYCPHGNTKNNCGYVSYGNDGLHLAVKYGKEDDPLEISFERVGSGRSMVV